jgi:preprotein translocase subunit SecE
VARDRQRAKQRKQERRGRATPNPGPAPSEPRRANVPGEWESGEVDEFEAALVAGAGGEAAGDPAVEDDAELGDDEQLLDEEAPASGGDVAAPVRAGQPVRGGNRFIAFLRASWAELQRVQWPDRRQVAQATAVVLGFVVIAGAYLGLADAAAQRVVDFIL